MLINNQPYRTIWLHPNHPNAVQIIDQRFLPHKVNIATLTTWQQGAQAIQEMWVRGAPLIGVTAAYSMYLAALQLQAAAATIQEPLTYLQEVAAQLLQTRPTAVNLQWAIQQQLKAAEQSQPDLDQIIAAALQTAHNIANQDVENCRLIGQHGLSLIQSLAQTKPAGEPVQVLTHCNAGWLACVDWGTATSPIYQAAALGIPIHVWVSETRPRNQGANLTAWELEQNHIPHTIVVDNACGYLLQHKMVDICIVGADRATRTGDAANKIGTYLKALAAKDNQTPFYVALPSATIDWQLTNGLTQIPIEQRHPDEVKSVIGWHNNTFVQALIAPPNSPAANFAFDVTPARLITGLITERGICPATENGLRSLFPDYCL